MTHRHDSTTEAPTSPHTDSLTKRIVGLLLSPSATFTAIAKIPRSTPALIAALTITTTSVFLTSHSVLHTSIATIWLLLQTLATAAIARHTLNVACHTSRRYPETLAIAAHTSLFSAITEIATQALTILPPWFNKSIAPSHHPTSLAMLLPSLPNTSTLAHTAACVDLFAIWWLVLVSIGFATLYHRRPHTLTVTLLATYAVTCILRGFLKAWTEAPVL